MIRDMIRLRASLRRRLVELKAKQNRACRISQEERSDIQKLAEGRAFELHGMIVATQSDYIAVRDMVSDWQRKRNKK